MTSNPTSTAVDTSPWTWESPVWRNGPYTIEAFQRTPPVTGFKRGANGYLVYKDGLIVPGQSIPHGHDSADAAMAFFAEMADGPAPEPYGVADDTGHDYHGATITRVVHAVRDNHYTSGAEFSDRDKAIAYARALSAKAHAYNRDQLDNHPVPVGISTAVQIDLRVIITFATDRPHTGGGIETVIDSFDIDDARRDPALKATECRIGWNNQIGQAPR